MLKKIINIIPTFSKYAFVGGIATLVDMGFLYLFVELFDITVLFAATISFITGNITSFLLNKFWTFENKSRNYRKLYLKFLSVSLVGLSLTIGFMHIFTNVLGIFYMLSKIITASIVLFWNFMVNRFWTFKIIKKELSILSEFPYEYSIIIPSYNEENRIKKTLLIIDDYLKTKSLPTEIIVVSDGSTDQTAKIVENYTQKIPNLKLIHYQKNQGKGHAVKKGIEESRGRYLLFTDADNSTPIEELDRLIKSMKENNAQIAIGSRYLKDSSVKIRQSRFRVLIGRVGNLLIRLFLIDGIVDTQCGFKIYEHKAAKEIFSLQKVKRFGFDMESLVIAKTLGYKIVEVPVSWFNSEESRVRPVKDALVTLKDLIYIKINLIAGSYSDKEL